MFKKKLSEWSMLPAQVEVTHFYGTYRHTGTVGSSLFELVVRYCGYCIFLKIYFGNSSVVGPDPYGFGVGPPGSGFVIIFTDLDPSVIKQNSKKSRVLDCFPLSKSNKQT